MRVALNSMEAYRRELISHQVASASNLGGFPRATTDAEETAIASHDRLGQSNLLGVPLAAGCDHVGEHAIRMQQQFAPAFRSSFAVAASCPASMSSSMGCGGRGAVCGGGAEFPPCRPVLSDGQAYRTKASDVE